MACAKYNPYDIGELGIHLLYILELNGHSRYIVGQQTALSWLPKTVMRLIYPMSYLDARQLEDGRQTIQYNAVF
jgi:hypothetical protein